MSEYRKKLIEVALPLDAINAASAREKSIRHGHPSTLHLWWARRPLAACRAVLFAQLVDDPSSLPDEFPTEEAQEQERQRLFGIIQALVPWENSNNKTMLDAARREIARSVARNAGVPRPEAADEVRRVLAEHAPPVLDPFCGGGSIPLEAQRLGLKAHASDLNPVAVLITKALIEIPPKFAGRPPVNPHSRARMGAESGWTGARGLAEDVRYYGQWMRDEAQKRIGHLYPKVRLPKEHGGGEATVIAWLWARTVTCPNPACRARMPLVRSFWLSTKPGKKAWVEPVVNHAAKTIRFEMKTGQSTAPEGTVNRIGARCIVCDTPVPFDYVRTEGKAGRMGSQMMAIVAEGQRERIYLPPTPQQEEIATQARPEWEPETNLPERALGFRVQRYGLTKHRDLFAARQLVALATYSDLTGKAQECMRSDAVEAGLPDDGVPLNECGTGATAYADAVATYLGMGVSRLSDICNSLCMWENTKTQVRHLFTRNAIPMLWDFAEPNVFAGAAGDFWVSLSNLSKALEITPECGQSGVKQVDATVSVNCVAHPLISTDPPYYDNVGYADLSDFFYIWLRHSLIKIYPDLFSTVLTPKEHELVASPDRFDGDRDKARRFFQEELGNAFERMHDAQHRGYPLAVYYAFKQAEAEDEGGDTSIASTTSTGWETMLEGLIRAGFAITGTWPMRTELGNRMRNIGSNALASSIVLICRSRPESAVQATRREFIATLRRELPDALKKLQHGNVAPVDLAQASIGPGMAIFSRYAQVLEADGSSMSVRTALQIISQELDAYLTAQEGEMDPETRFCVAWFEQYGMRAAKFGEADVLARAKNTSVEGLRRAGVLHATGGDVRLRARTEMDAEWDPRTDRRVTDWECAQHLIGALSQDGEDGAARLAQRMGGEKAQIARDLAYRLFAICERKKWPDEALAYNALVASWPAIQEKAAHADGEQQGRLF
jgi:putative DNA methylase